MKVTDYIVEFLIEKGVTDVFGYPGGMVTHLMESFSKAEGRISAHVNYHEQASAFSACGYAQTSGKLGVAYATSGPGATNLITGVCNAYFDSIPVIFITGQVNSFESKGCLAVRQRGFQETDIISMVRHVTKFAQTVDKSEKIRYYMEKAYYMAVCGRPGPVLLDIPMDVQRSDVEIEALKSYEDCNSYEESFIDVNQILKEMKCSKRPCVLVGAGVKNAKAQKSLLQMANMWKIPFVTSMIAFDALPKNCENNYGFIGAYGDRVANFILAKSDLVISIGSRLDIRQVGAIKTGFAMNAKLVRVDIDRGELTNKIKEDEIQVLCDASSFINKLLETREECDREPWLDVCNVIRNTICNIDERIPNKLIKKLGSIVPAEWNVTTDVGQNQVWVAQSFDIKQDQNVLFSGGHGAMGYSLPAAIGAYYASKRPVISFNGDGGFQMNIQELQFIVRENIPITIVILNNQALGMIRHFQEMYFESNYFQTIESGGYSVPNFESIAKAYGLTYYAIREENDVLTEKIIDGTPKIVEILLENFTYVFPKLEYGKPNQDQEPQLERKIYNMLMLM